LTDPGNISSAVELLTAVIKLKAGGETRTQQVEAVTKINEAIENSSNLVIEAPTGAGKTISYMIPVLFNETRAVISTATKTLSEQIVNIDVPFLKKALKQVMPALPVNVALLKGRDNYFCLAKAEDNSRLSSQASTLFGDDTFADKGGKGSGKGGSAVQAKRIAGEIKNVTDWANTTKTGDRSEAPPVSDQVWKQFSSNTAECPGKQVCPFGEQCFAEFAREKARKANVVITNHAVVAHDLIGEESIVLGDRDLFVFDEMHDLDNYLSSAWGTKLTSFMLKDAYRSFNQLKDLDSKITEEFEQLGKKFNGVCETVPEGNIEGKPEVLSVFVSRLYGLCGRAVKVATVIAKDDSENAGQRKVASVVVRKASALMHSCELILDDSPNTVRWVTLEEDKNAVNAAPLRVGPKLQDALELREANMVGTSATIRVNGDFDIPVHNLALKNSSSEFETVALDTPFDYKKQAMMYIPAANSFPAPVGSDRVEHTAAVQQEMIDLVGAMGGRALCLFTTTYAAKEAGKVLRKKYPKLNVLIQDDAPAPQLIELFKKDETSVLVATMGMWHGLDVPGPSCSLVIIDKIPFKPMNDPLSVARQKWANESGRNGFMDVYVADATTPLTQGAGRLIRAMDDKGVVAILDTRLTTKPYGRAMLKSLPPMLIFQDKEKIVAALKRLSVSLDGKK
jgi:ATP-dependent DNA helicase DinG